MSIALFFFSQDCFSYLDFFLWYLNFRIVFLILKKKKKASGKDCIEYADHFG